MRAIWYGSSKKRTNAPTTSAEQDIQNMKKGMYIDYTFPSSIQKMNYFTGVIVNSKLFSPKCTR